MKAQKPSPVPPDAFADLLPVEAMYIAPGEYEMVAATGQRLFYVEGSALAEWLRDRINGTGLEAIARIRSRSKKQQIAVNRLRDETPALDSQEGDE